MSLVTTLPIEVAPSAAGGLSISTGATSWAYGSWVEAITLTSGAIQVVGLELVLPSAALYLEVQIGTGAAGSEAGIGSIFIDLTPSNVGLSSIVLPIAVDNIPTSTRVAVRLRGSVGSTAMTVALMYIQGLDSSQKSSAPYAYVPAGSGASAGVAITPNASAWTNSAWVELTSGIGNEITLLGTTCRISAASNIEYELDLGTGASGSELVITTLRSDNGTRQGFTNLWLPAPYPLAANTRVACRLRKSDTTTSAVQATLLYLNNSSALATAVNRKTFSRLGTRTGSRHVRH